MPQPIPDFGRLADPTTQTGIQFQAYDKTPLTFTSKTIYVQVPVVVTDKDGKPVAGLKKEDFHLQENGKEQNIASLEAIQSSAAPLARPVVPGNEVRNQTSSDATPRRLVIIALDMVNTPFEDQASARRALIKYLSENIEPDSLYQLVAVENNGLRILHDFTDETAPLIATLKSFGSKVTDREKRRWIRTAGRNYRDGTSRQRPNRRRPRAGNPVRGAGSISNRHGSISGVNRDARDSVSGGERRQQHSVRLPADCATRQRCSRAQVAGLDHRQLPVLHRSGQRFSQCRDVIRGVPARHAIAGRRTDLRCIRWMRGG